MAWGSPVHARSDFDIAEVLRWLNEESIACEDQGEASEDERELEDDVSTAPMSPSPTPPEHFSTLPDLLLVTPPSPLTPVMEPPAVPPPSSLAAASTPLAPVAMPSDASVDTRTRKKKHVKAHRAQKRAAEQELKGRQLKTVTLKHREGMDAIHSDMDPGSLSITSTGWIGSRIPEDKSSLTLEEVTHAPYNLHHVKWDGL
jgi:hypothetical protein